MKAFTYSEARQRLSDVLDSARQEEVIIKRRGGETFSLVYKKAPESPFDIPGLKTKATTADILSAVRESRSRAPAPGVSRRGGQSRTFTAKGSTRE